MSDLASKPRVFVSSTIKDFRDLRSALHHWLSSMGCDVVMSEFNDFDRRPEQGSFDSCFDAIKTCQYYILIIGGQKGSSYDENVSVTQQEYRVASALSSRGQIKPIIFVRSEVSNALSERRALRTEGMDYSKLLQISSPILSDAEFIENFLEETKASEGLRQSPQQLPGKTWCYKFTNFADIVDALVVNMNLYWSVRKQVLMANLREELHQNLSSMSLKTSSSAGPVVYHHWEVSPVRANLIIPSDERLENQIGLDKDQAQRIAGFLLTGLRSSDAFRVSHLQEALSSGEFLDYDQQDQTLRPSELTRILQRLLANLERYRSLTSSGVVDSSTVYGHIQSHRQAARYPVPIQVFELAWVYSLHDILDNVLRLSTVLLDHIDSSLSELRMPPLYPLSPLSRGSRKVEDEIPTLEDIDVWVRTARQYVFSEVIGDAR